MEKPLETMQPTSIPTLTPYDFDEKDANNLTRRAINNLRPMKVLVLGAGMPGVLAGILIPRAVENLELVIYEKNADPRGTWYESSPKWSSYWAGGAEIHDYMKDVAQKYDAVKYIKFRHKCQRAEWDATAGKWRVTLDKLDTGEVGARYNQDLQADWLICEKTITDTADVVILGRKPLNHWTWPKTTGLLSTFKGDWDENYSVDGERVVVIGGGSSGIKILPQIQPKIASVDHYMKRQYTSRRSSRLLVSRNSLRRHHQQAPILSSIQHPNVASIWNVYCYDDENFLVMAYLSLRISHIEIQKHELEEWEIATIVSEVGSGDGGKKNGSYESN